MVLWMALRMVLKMLRLLAQWMAQWMVLWMALIAVDILDGQWVVVGCSGWQWKNVGGLDGSGWTMGGSWHQLYLYSFEKIFFSLQMCLMEVLTLCNVHQV